MSGPLWACVLAGLMVSNAVPVSLAPGGTGGSFPSQTAKARAETARWMAHANDWGYLATIDPGSTDKPLSEISSFSDGLVGASTGRLWFYLMGLGLADAYPASLTMSQAAINKNLTCVVHGLAFDPEDPMCAKLTIQGTMTKASLSGLDDVAVGKQALFGRHPQMKKWPADHGFEVYELKIEDIWMIDFYGGGGTVPSKDYFKNEPIHNVPAWPPKTPHLNDAEVVLATFDGKSTTHKFYALNDPVMGGESISTVTTDISRKVLLWQGTVAVVPYLGKPGFCTMRSADGERFPNLLGTVAIKIQLQTEGNLTNFEAQIHALDERSAGTYSAKFTVLADSSEQTILIDWTQFVFTCRGEKKEAPPLTDQLDKIFSIGLGTSGLAGAFGIQLSRISAVAFPAAAPSHIRGPPPHDQVAARARWLVYHSLWSSVATVSVRLGGKPWGNVRSIADGIGTNSTGLPVFYLPTPDPTSIDIASNSHATLSFSEASLVARIDPKSRPGMRCGGMDAEDSTCARLFLKGKLRALAAGKDIDQAKFNLGARHPLAPWLATGGAHTGGAYYTIDVDELVFLDYYGGPSPLSLKEYLEANPPTSSNADW